MNNQSGVIFGFLFIGFLVFITIRGELPIYAGLLLSTPKQAAGGASVVSGADVAKIAQAASTLSILA